MIGMILDWARENHLLTLTLAALALELIGILSALEAILKTRTSQGAIAWSLSLITLPLIMVPLYWIFGRRKFLGYKRARDQSKLEIRIIAAQLARAMEHHRSDKQALSRQLPVLERIVELSHSRGNEVQLLIDGQHTFDTLFAAIDRAQDYILLEFYIVRDDAIGRELKQRLLNKAAAGVAVYFIYDEIGSLHLSNGYVGELRRAGVHISPFNTTKGPRNRFQLNFRNHRKIACVDGRWAMLGGINIGDEYLGRHPRLTPWRDTSVAIRGPAVQSVQLSFLEDWYWAQETVPPLNWIPVRSEQDMTALALATGPADTLDSCVLIFLHLIHSAKRRLWIVSPYFVPDGAVLNALQLAALRGVDVRLLLPDTPDHKLVKLSSYAYIKDALMAGVRFFRFEAGFLHQKVLLIDDELASVGTTNLDNRSFRLNFEINLLVQDREFALRVEQMLSEDFRVSRQVSLGEVSNLPLYRRLLIRCAYLFAPVQ